MYAATNKLKTWLPALWIASEGTLRMKYKEPRFVCQPCCVRLDSVVYNPGAIYWDTVENTPVKRLDLMYEVNLRGAFALSRCVLPTLRAQVRALSWCHAVARHVASVAMPRVHTECGHGDIRGTSHLQPVHPRQDCVRDNEDGAYHPCARFGARVEGNQRRGTPHPQMQ